MTRLTALPPGARVHSEIGPVSNAKRIALLRERNRAALLANGATNRGEFSIDALLPSTNELLRMNYIVRAQHTALWRGWGGAASIPAIVGRVGIEVHSTAGRGGGIGDAASRCLAVKAIVDGACDAGILQDDSPEFVAYERHWAPTRADRPSLRIVLAPIDSVTEP